MAQNDLPARESETSVETIAARLEATDAVPVANVILETSDDDIVRQCGRSATALAAVRIAWRRTQRGEIDREDACSRLAGDVELDLATVAHAEAMLEYSICSPAPDEEIRALRRAIVAGHEILAAIENDRANGPRLSGSVFADVDPSLAALATLPLDRIDEAELRAHLQRLEADLEMARLGVELYAAVHEE
ncbi:hypothetical protein OB955_11970 [Halobacteria archaeon AArc-m2/3/4]|uniref:Uncharacterized protein n=1 Tax=Natronoglomus mannanivorans TaxID=2979990 RepID=A0AAP3E2L0_9EURY|nr:hypothetical protein [Halobacteria archaeon AArc-xg1-1]MCU4973457.1 hypothetical protein [Halobacteria archaeon AArc-m2/3/4]